MVLLLAGCAAVIRQEGRTVTKRQHAIMRELYDLHAHGSLDDDALYALEDRLHAMCEPLERRTYARMAKHSLASEPTAWVKVAAILECGRLLDIVCEEQPRFCRHPDARP